MIEPIHPPIAVTCTCFHRVRSLARDLVEAITRYTNKPINYPFRMRPAYFTSPLQGAIWALQPPLQIVIRHRWSTARA